LGRWVIPADCRHKGRRSTFPLSSTLNMGTTRRRLSPSA
jgi:hypothetical protein